MGKKANRVNGEDYDLNVGKWKCVAPLSVASFVAGFQQKL
jgi:hypothetical protein